MNTEQMMSAIADAAYKSQSPNKMNPEMAIIWGRLSKKIGNPQELNDTMEALILLQELLNEGVAHFGYEKKDGTVRNAFGTRNPDIIKSVSDIPDPDGNRPQNRTPGVVMTYFDLEKCEWRCFVPENLIRVDPRYLTD